MPEYTITRHRGKYALTFNEGGRRLRITTGTADERLAESRAREIWARRNATASERIADLWPLYVKDRGSDGVGTARFAHIWTALAPHFAARTGSQITREDCRGYHQARKLDGMAPSTIATELSLLRACLRWKYGTQAPAVWIPPVSQPRSNWLTKDQVREIMDATDTPHIRLFLILAVTTGARASAILDLTWDRVDFEQNIIDYKPAGRATTNKRRVEVSMNGRAKAALEEAYRGRLTDHVIEFGGKPVGTVKKALQRLSAKTGIKFSAHVFRHTAAVWMAQADVPMTRIAQALGHTKTAVTEQYYARYSPSFMRDASAATEF